MSEQLDDINDVDPMVEKAMSRGWRPQDEWEGEANEWVDADEFNRRGELMDTISQLNKRDKSRETRIEQLESALKALGDHNKKLAEKEYEKALETLKKQKVRALESEDYEAILEVDDQIDQIKEAKRQADSVPETTKTSNEVNPKVEAWKEKNTWFESNIVMRGAADALVNDYIAKHPNWENDIDSVLEFVDENMKKSFPEELGQRRRPSATTEASGSQGKGTSGAKGKFTARHLSADQRRIGETLVKAGAFEKIQDYVNQLAELGELE